MKYPGSLISKCIRAISESMDSRTMTAITRELLRGYDLHERTGFPESIPIPNLSAAKQIISDIVKEDLLLPFVSLLIDLHDKGRQGRRYQIPMLRQVIKEIFDLGFIYDNANSIFVEDPRIRRTRNWGVLHEGYEYNICFLRLDIAGNSSLVRRYPENLIKKTYNDVRAIVNEAIEKRDGRIWSWEGDGGLVAFYFGNFHVSAILSAMEINHALFMYNMEENRLGSPLVVRIAVHGGSVEYTDNEENLMKSETVKRAYEIEQRYTPPGAVTISEVVKVMVDEVVANEFAPVRDGNQTYYAYALQLE